MKYFKQKITQLFCFHKRSDAPVKTGYVTASDDLAGYFWSEKAETHECPKCKKLVTWSLRRETNAWQPTN